MSKQADKRKNPQAKQKVHFQIGQGESSFLLLEYCVKYVSMLSST